MLHNEIDVPEQAQQYKVKDRKLSRFYNIFLQYIDSTHRLHVVEVHELDEDEAYAQSVNSEDFPFEYMLMSSLVDMKTHELLSDRELFGDFFPKNNDQCGVVQLNKPGKMHLYGHHFFNIPTNKEAMLRFLMAIDTPERAMTIMHEEVDAAVPQFNYWHALPADMQSLGEVVGKVCINPEDNQALFTTRKESMSRTIAKWIHQNLSGIAGLTGEQLTVKELLEKLLATPDESLTRAAFLELNKSFSIDNIVAENCVNGDGLLAAQMISPKVSIEQKALAIKSYLQGMYLLSASKEAADTAINTWFDLLSDLQVEVWNAMISEIFGCKAFDGGWLFSGYTEIQLLKQAKLVLNSDNLFELSYLDTKAYADIYAQGTANHDVLESELRLTCKLMGLEFVPGQDFHKTAAFTPESTKFLMERGFHINKESSLKLLQTNKADYAVARLFGVAAPEKIAQVESPTLGRK